MEQTPLIDFLLGIVGGLVSGAFSGYYAAWAKVGYEHRATTTNELRSRTIEAKAAFHNWIARPAYTTHGTGDYDGVTNVGVKSDALSAYFRAHREWLDGKSRESMERILVSLGMSLSCTHDSL